MAQLRAIHKFRAVDWHKRPLVYQEEGGRLRTLSHPGLPRQSPQTLTRRFKSRRSEKKSELTLRPARGTNGKALQGTGRCPPPSTWTAGLHISEMGGIVVPANLKFWQLLLARQLK